VSQPRGESSTLATRLDRLFRTVRPAGRGEYSYEEVATAIRATGVTISHTYLWQLRKGLRDNPTKRHIEALAHFFGVRPAYFFDDEVAESTDAQLEVLAAMRDSGVRSVALRTAGLSPGSLRAIRGMIEHARQIEGLPADPPPE
jgi:transcriptional regulator with XRE-family HTH domain